jgi:hypothetical protein
MKKLIKMLGLKPLEGQAEVTEDQIAEAVSALNDRAAEGDLILEEAKKINKVLKLDPDASISDVLEAIKSLKNQKAAGAADTERETKIAQLMQKTGMQRTDAEHVIDQQAREDKARKAPKK